MNKAAIRQEEHRSKSKNHAEENIIMTREINKMQQRKSCEKTVEERHTGFEVLEAAPNDKFVSASFSSNYHRSRLKKKVASIIPTSLTRKRKVKIIEAFSNT